MKHVLALVLFATSSLFAQTTTPMPPTPPPCTEPSSVTVTGSAIAQATPDRVSFSIGVQTESGSVSEAFAQNNAKTRRVVDALKARGVRDPEIQTSNFSIESPYEPETRRQSVTRFLVRNTVTVTRENPQGVSELLQAAVDAGANQAGELRFFVANPTEARNRAIDRAFADARAQAERLAAASAKKLGEVMMITTASMPYGPQYNNAVAEAITVTAQAPTIEAGSTAVNYSVTVTFRVQ